MNKFVKGFVEARWWARLLLAVVFIVILLLLLNAVLKFLTNHGQKIPVPKVTGLTYEEAKKALEDKGLRYVITDSVFAPNAKKDEVVDQNPAANNDVKKGRIIYLTVNALPVPMVEMPDVTERTLRQAVNILQSNGLQVGELIKVPDRVTNDYVLKQRYKGKIISPGTRIEKGSKIDLEVTVNSKGGASSDAEEIEIPDLTGQTQQEANNVAKMAGFSLGSIVYDKNVTNKADALIYKQEPIGGIGKTAPAGTEIDIFLKEVK